MDTLYISVQHPLEKHVHMHETIGHDRCKQCKPWWQILIINIVLIVQYAMDNSAKLCQSLPWKHWGACLNSLHHIPPSTYGRHYLGSKISLLGCPLHMQRGCRAALWRWGGHWLSMHSQCEPEDRKICKHNYIHSKVNCIVKHVKSRVWLGKLYSITVAQ